MSHPVSHSRDDSSVWGRTGGGYFAQMLRRFFAQMLRRFFAKNPRADVTQILCADVAQNLHADSYTKEVSARTLEDRLLLSLLKFSLYVPW
jgi:hypothetical protein